jgi:hypothetical protein
MLAKLNKDKPVQVSDTTMLRKDKKLVQKLKSKNHTSLNQR